uniref:Uncharacterized protein n=1 Tax=Plectus sambesii TaxID=2011161 RepID=A0A914X5M1_9BILA
MAELSALNAIVKSAIPILWLGIERLDTTSSDLNQGWYLTSPTDPPVPTTFLPWSTISPPNSASRAAWLVPVLPGSIQATYASFTNPVLCQYDNKTATTTTTPTISSTTTTKPITTTTTTTSTTTGAAKNKKERQRSGQAKPTNTNNGDTIQLCQRSPDKSHRRLEVAGVVVQHGQDGAFTVASIQDGLPIRQRVDRRLHEGRVGRNGAQHNTRPSARKLAMNRTEMRRQHAARTVGGTGITSCPPDFGAERHRRRRHRPEISPQPATALLRPPEEQSRRSDNKTTTAEKYTIPEHRRRASKQDRAPVEHRRRAIETALQPNIVGEQSRPRSSLTVSASLQWPGVPPKGHTLGAHPPALRNSSELPN